MRSEKLSGQKKTCKKKTKGYFSLLLHAHLPYVRHPEYKEFLEEDWLFEAITECYISLLDVFDGLVHDGIKFKITMSLTPTLVSMLSDSFLRERYIRHIDKLIKLADKEVARTRWDHQLHGLALFYYWKFVSTKKTFIDVYDGNIVAGFKKFQDLGVLEIITSGATHGFIPLLDVNPSAARAQIKIACEHYQKHFGRRPKGIWLPECGYKPGIEEYLAECKISYFFTDAHGVLHASKRPKYGVFAPILTPAGVACFGRDIESSKQVWSSQEGYPGDHAYREFYRDVGFDLDYDYIKPFLHEDGNRVNLGIKYYKITGKGDFKKPYNPTEALEKAATHAGNFMFNREKQVDYLHDFLGRKPIIVSPYDAELFGHWWYEGPQWINFLMRKMHHDQETIEMITPSEYLEKHKLIQVSTPSLSSWGHKGYCEFWLGGDNDWVYRHLHKSADRMQELANANPEAEGVLRRALNQAARELLLAQSSDWAFIMKTGTMVDYAVRRTKSHIARFTTLYNFIKNNEVSEEWLEDVENMDNIFESDGESLLVDVGITTKQVRLRMEKISSDIGNIKGILITHEHSDHTKGLEIISRLENIPVHINKQTYEAFVRKTKKQIPEDRLFFFDIGEQISIGNFSVQPFPIPHDAEETVGLVVRRGDIKIGIATDLGHTTHLIRERLKDSNILVLESNHNVSQLMSGPYPWALKQRIRGKNGHLSNEDALALLCHLAHKDLQHVIFSHVSDTNNNLDSINKAFERWVPKKRQTFSFNIVAPNGMGTPYTTSF